MARGRLIDKQIYLNEKLAKLSIESRYLYQGMIVHSDDKGRMKANPSLLRALIFPFDHTIRIDTIKLWRDKIVSVDLIKLYVCDETEYLSHPNWEKWQPIRKDRIKPSDSPDPPSMVDKCQTDVRHLSVTCQPIPNLTEPNLTPGELRSQCRDKSSFGEGKEKEEEKEKEKKEKDKPPKEKEYKITTELQSVVCKYKTMKGIKKEDRSWDKVNWARSAKSAKHILEVMDTWELACDYMDAQSKELERKKLDWTIETLAKRVDEFKAALSRGEDKWSSN